MALLKPVLRVSCINFVVVQRFIVLLFVASGVSVAACSGGDDEVGSGVVNNSGYVPATAAPMLPLPPGAGPRELPVIRDAGAVKDVSVAVEAAADDAASSVDARPPSDAGPTLDASG